MTTSKKITILGGGLSGLACAVTLQRKGIPFTLLEKNNAFGGRIKTAVHADGFLIDAGFQVLLDSYPELPGFFNLKALQLQAFASGAKIFDGEKILALANPLRHPQHLFQTAFSSLANTRDKLLVIKLIVVIMSAMKADKSSPLPASQNTTTLEYLQEFGFSKPFIDQFWLPFFTGIFLDPHLTADASFFIFLLKCFSFGQATLPAQGMSAIPDQLISQLDKSSLKLSTSTETLDFEGITVKAFAYPGKLVRKATTYSFATPETLDWGKWLVLVPPHLGLQINQLAHMNAVAENYSPRGQNLISATSVGAGAPASPSAIAAEIERIAGRSLALTHLKTDEITHALPEFRLDAPQFLKQGNVYECGDHLSDPSTNGALRSGRRVAEEIIKQYTF